MKLDLRIEGQLVRILAVHMKSSCVSPFEARGDLTSGGDNCPVLQMQVAPFEAWVEANSGDTDKVVVIGDFNRDFWREQIERAETDPVRSDASDPAGTLPAGVLVRNFFREVFDGAPVGTTFSSLPEECAINALAKQLCEIAETRILTSAERNQLGAKANLGCRNPIGLDHIVIGSGFTADHPAQHIAVGKFGGTLPAGTHPDPLLAISDHCPMKAALTM